jgi:thioredoxin reductase
MLDVIVAGAGPAGLQAALTLGRARRRVLVCDSGEPRNTFTGVVHGFLSRDGVDPTDLREIALDELRRYPTVELRRATITDARSTGDAFSATLDDGTQLSARKLILATGLVDDLSAPEGLAEIWGRAAFHCVYCDGFERADRPLAVIDSGPAATFVALHATRWSDDVVLVTGRRADLGDEDRARLSRRGIPVNEQPIQRLEVDGDAARIVFADGATLDGRTIFVHPPTRQRSDLALRLGCNALDDGSIEVNDFGQTTVPGVYAAGDMARRPAFPFPAAQVIHAASSGGIAAVVADRELLWAEVQ